MPQSLTPALSCAQVRYVVFAASWASFATMAVEMLFARIVASYFGSGIAVWGSIITVLLLAMAAGYLWGGKLSQRSVVHPTRFYQLLLWLACTLVPMVLISDLILSEITYWMTDSRYGSLLGASLLLAAPGWFAGSLTPYAMRLIVTRVEEAGARAGLLSAMTTLGAAAGTILPSYYLVLWWEINTILLGLVIMTAAIAGLPWLLWSNTAAPALK
ncbi:fused MFS/spermidine synthase [Lampropedia puyangensis]|nr:fused MFS/spermidine synthase [Lampropedia puyangensis]